MYSIVLFASISFILWDVAFGQDVQLVPQTVLDHAIEILHELQVKRGNCFLAIVTTIEKDCSSLIVNDTGRVELALRFTLCELSTSHIDIPGECQPLSHPTACVQALAKTPQLWTTYSGN
ncbi:hypothetical protein DM01DRAFT_1017657 [Hesseltinella vesiculosa]|uniref:Uncharacterized protein n=1 Tax=Hesseltinella vesiculosa TaxID=101127 RepID=A0A1X2GL02_9FUNG|nr:hypothetical protein DM01DRAFT_1017657 [Hesseltinella vesiculosa]